MSTAEAHTSGASGRNSGGKEAASAGLVTATPRSATCGCITSRSVRGRCSFCCMAPTLVIWAESDGYLGPELAQPDHDDVPNLDRVERLLGASHWVHHDQAQRVTQLLIDFFAPAKPVEKTGPPPRRGRRR